MSSQDSSICALAGDISCYAQASRVIARAVIGVQAVHWEAPAADSLRLRLVQVARRMEHSADSLEDAATAVLAHARAVEEVRAVVEKYLP